MIVFRWLSGMKLILPQEVVYALACLASVFHLCRSQAFSLMNFSISPLFVVMLGDLHFDLVQSIPDVLRLPIYRLSYDNVGLLATFATLFA